MVPDDPDSFAEEMARMGVKPLPGKKPFKQPLKKPPGPGQARAAVAQSQARPQPARPASAPARPQPARAESSSAPAPASASAPAPAAVARPEPAEPAELRALRDAAARAEQAERVLAAEREQWQREREKWQREREQWQRERARHEDRNRQLRHSLAEAEKAAQARTRLADLLSKRGCADRDEAIQVMRGLMDKRPDQLIDVIELTESEPLARLLDDRVAFVAHDLDVDLGADTVVVRVPAARCEITGGSDIQAGFRQFVEACQRAQVRRVTIVGGSPSYRRELDQLAASHKDLKLNLVSGTKRRERKRAEADKRTSDIVVIWGATELDHSVSAVYTQGTGKVLTVRHRGISGMLEQLTEHLLRGSR